MKRSSARDGKRGTESGRDFDVAVPDQAIWSVIHTGLFPAAATMVFVTSPTTLMSVFDRRACRPGGYATGEMSAPVISNAGREGLSWATVPTGARVITTGWSG